VASPWANVRAQLPAARTNIISGRAPGAAESPKLSLLGSNRKLPAKSKFENQKSIFGAVAEK